MSKKIRKLQLFSGGICLAICIASLVLLQCTYIFTKRVEDIQKNIEYISRSEIRSNLDRLKYELEDEVEKGLNIYDDEIITKFIIDHFEFNNELIQDYAVINIGYSHLSNRYELSVALNSKDTDESIKNELMNIDTDRIFKGISNKDINDNLYELALTITSKYDNTDFLSIYNTLRDIIFDKEKIIFSSTKDVNYINDLGSSITDEWIETKIIPTSLGFNNEPEYKSGQPNINYKKLLIRIKLNKEKILEPYKLNINTLYTLKNIINILIVILVFCTMILLVRKSILCIAENNAGGDNIVRRKSDNSNSCSDISCVWECMCNRTKQSKQEYGERNKKE